MKTVSDTLLCSKFWVIIRPSTIPLGYRAAEHQTGHREVTRSANLHSNNNLDGQAQVIVDRPRSPVHQSQIRRRSALVCEGRRENRGIAAQQ